MMNKKKYDSLTYMVYKKWYIKRQHLVCGIFNVEFFVFEHFVKISGEHMAKYWVGGQACCFDKVTSHLSIVVEQKALVFQSLEGLYFFDIPITQTRWINKFPQIFDTASHIAKTKKRSLKSSQLY